MEDNTQQNGHTQLSGVGKAAPSEGNVLKESQNKGNSKTKTQYSHTGDGGLEQEIEELKNKPSAASISQDSKHKFMPWMNTALEKENSKSDYKFKDLQFDEKSPSRVVKKTLSSYERDQDELGFKKSEQMESDGENYRKSKQSPSLFHDRDLGDDQKVPSY